MEEIVKNLNIKCNIKHWTLENMIKRIDSSVEMTRSNLFSRYIDEAADITDWVTVYRSLTQLQLDQSAAQFSNYQCKYSNETEVKYLKVLQNMQESLINAKIITKVLQTQFALQLIMQNYLLKITKAKAMVKDSDDVEKISLPNMAATLTEMMLVNPDCDEIRQINNILLDWRKRNG